MKRRKVALSFLGTMLDNIVHEKRHQKWRPTMTLMQGEDPAIDHLVLFASVRHKELVKILQSDIEELGKTVEVIPFELGLGELWKLDVVYSKLYDFATTFAFDHQKADYFVHITTGTHIAQIALFLLVEAGYIPGVLVQSSPGLTPETKARGLVQIIDLDLSKYEMIMARYEKRSVQNTSILKAGIETKNAAFNEMIQEIETVSASGGTLLLCGPTGAGKTRMAARIHELKKSLGLVRGAFVELNCATLRGDTAMSALFGHTKGAYTGALEPRAGALLTANEGVLFLDEIGELSLDVQAALLRAVEDGVFRPVGSDKEKRSSFHLLAGTNRDLRAMVEAGAFREDLLARINLWTFRMPGLTERREDIAPNLDFELAKTEKKAGKRFLFEKAARERYLSFAVSPEALWRGNFRDLAASIQRMTTLSTHGRIDTRVVEREITRLLESWGSPSKDGSAVRPPPALPVSVPQKHADRVQTALMMIEIHGSITAAARNMDEYRNQKNPGDGLRKFLVRKGIKV